MAIFGGPSKKHIIIMAQGVASTLMQLIMLDELDSDARVELLISMRADGIPSSKEELLSSAASLVAEQNMGWIRKNQYIGAIYYSLISMGMPDYSAKYWKGKIQLLAGF